MLLVQNVQLFFYKDGLDHESYRQYYEMGNQRIVHVLHIIIHLF